MGLDVGRVLRRFQIATVIASKQSHNNIRVSRHAMRSGDTAHCVTLPRPLPLPPSPHRPPSPPPHPSPPASLPRPKYAIISGRSTNRDINLYGSPLMQRLWRHHVSRPLSPDPRAIIKSYSPHAIAAGSTPIASLLFVFERPEAGDVKIDVATRRTGR